MYYGAMTDQDRRDSFEEVTKAHTDWALEDIAKGKPLLDIVSNIVQFAARWGADNVREYEKKHGSKPKNPAKPEKPVKANDGWRPMSSAPKDGTLIIVTETPNGEHWNVLPAAWMAQGQNNNDDNAENGDWWGITPSRSIPGEGPLYVRWTPLALTPVCWRPMPEPEPESKLRRRMGQMFRQSGD